MVYKWLNYIQLRLFPPHCMLCGNLGMNGDPAKSQNQVKTGYDLCQACLNDLPKLESACPTCAQPLQSHTSLVCGQCLKAPPPFQFTFSPFEYAPPIPRLITDLKFNQKLAPARLFGRLLADELRGNNIPLPEVLIPVPLHPKRIHERGYNQSLELARIVGKILNLPVDYQLCQRTRHTQPQTGLDATARRKNIRGAFTLHDACHYQHIAIIDDVITTGNTVTEISKLFKKKGVETIQVWSIARATKE